MRIYDYVDEGLGHSSYLIDIGDGTVAIVDPPRFATAHEALAKQLKSQIVWTFDTHSHADYVTGSPRLALRAGATFVAPATSHLETAHQPVTDGDSIDLGNNLSMTAIATSGHTPDHHAYILKQSGVPVALFSGGSLMVGTIGRTDLCGPELTESLAHEMFNSLRRFDDLPDSLKVYPTHGAGSFCSAPGSTERITTLGHERVSNPLFALKDEATFVEQLINGFGTFPIYFARLPELNRLGPNHYEALPLLSQLDPDQVESHLKQGGVVIDVRSSAAFADGHLAGSISIALRPVLASWLGWIVKPDQPIVFVMDDDQDRNELVRQCFEIGHERLVGELTFGIKSWTNSGRPVEKIKFVEVPEMVGQIIDVRQSNEFHLGHVPTALNIELGSIAHAEIPSGALTIMCGHGERAMTGASILAKHGRTDIVVLNGGSDTWFAATGIQLETE